jgi:hypothetical protein
MTCENVKKMSAKPSVYKQPQTTIHVPHAQTTEVTHSTFYILHSTCARTTMSAKPSVTKNTTCTVDMTLYHPES